MNETYQDYINRVVPMTLQANYQTQLNHIQKSAKFEQGKAVNFPGYTIMTPTCEVDNLNQEFYSQIESLKQQINQNIPTELLVMLPLESFHLTIADLIWENNYLAGIKDNPEFENNLRQEVDKSFTEYKKTQTATNPLEFQILGVTIFPRAMAISLVAKTEADYQQINQLRQSIYQNRNLIALGVQQQYPFTAHITIGYFGEISPEVKSPSGSISEKLIQSVDAINQQLIDVDTFTLKIERVQLHKFDNMINYYREADWPEVVYLDNNESY